MAGRTSGRAPASTGLLPAITSWVAVNGAGSPPEAATASWPACGSTTSAGARDRHGADCGGSDPREQAYSNRDADEDPVSPDDVKEPAQVRCRHAHLASAPIPASRPAWRQLPAMIRPGRPRPPARSTTTDGHA